MTLYETTFVLDSQLKDEGWEESVAKYSGIITSNGTIKETYLWGVRRLAYEIAKQTHGYYVHIIHESAPTVPRELERQFQLDENCMRHMTVLADNPRYLEEMAKLRARQAESETETAKTAAKPDAAPAASAAPAAPAAPVAPAASTAPAESAPAATKVEAEPAAPADPPAESPKEDDKETK